MCGVSACGVVYCMCRCVGVGAYVLVCWYARAMGLWCVVFCSWCTFWCVVVACKWCRCMVWCVVNVSVCVVLVHAPGVLVSACNWCR